MLVYASYKILTTGIEYGIAFRFHKSQFVKRKHRHNDKTEQRKCLYDIDIKGICQ